MTLNFSKYHGAGNDFIIIDNRNENISLSTDRVKDLCHRQFSVGADGLMLLESDSINAFRMRYFNSDGLEGTMCGNGGRCIVMFAHKLGMFEKNIVFSGIDGNHEAEILDLSNVRLKMKDVDSINIVDDHYIIDTGSPHFIQFVTEVNHVDVPYQGKMIRNTFCAQTGGVNANFAHFVADGIMIRTYERGVEAETLACGTGAVATAIAANHWYNESKDSYTLYAKGGTLNVTFERVGDMNYKNIWLTGPAVHVFDGTISID
jgi:diaminopimelate epimerase